MPGVTVQGVTVPGLSQASAVGGLAQGLAAAQGHGHVCAHVRDGALSGTPMPAGAAVILLHLKKSAMLMQQPLLLLLLRGRCHQ